MEKILKPVRQVIKICTAGAGIVMIGVMMMIVVTALARLIGYSIPGTFDVIEVYMMIVGAYAVAYCETLEASARAEIITSRVSSRVRTGLATFTTFLNVIYWTVLFYAGWKVLMMKIQRGERTELLNANIVPSRSLWVLALALICIFLFLKLLDNFAHAVKPSKKDTSTAEGVSR
ncbi:MAG TPA: TRAP transporter small permease subunit [Syntrophorhabdaceae bacterium]|nr:TRAP transporter small permease subunit [Syntrophorhabdaceae bacterium]